MKLYEHFRILSSEDKIGSEFSLVGIGTRLGITHGHSQLKLIKQQTQTVVRVVRTIPI